MHSGIQDVPLPIFIENKTKLVLHYASYHLDLLL